MKFIFVMICFTISFAIGVAVGLGSAHKQSYESPPVAPQLATVMTYVEYKDSICAGIKAGKNVCK
jgi:hypothetical protein